MKWEVVKMQKAVREIEDTGEIQAEMPSPLGFPILDTTLEQQRIVEPGSLSLARRSSGVISVLHRVQHQLGHLPIWAQRSVADQLDVPFSQVHGVVTFYNHFSEKPRGRHTIQLCQGTTCYVRGGKGMREGIRKLLGIRPGDTTEDGRFTLDVVRCLGCCGLAPVITVDGDIHRRANPKMLSDILGAYE